MLPVNELFTGEYFRSIMDFYNSYEAAQEKIFFRQLPPHKVKTVFYGDSITWGFDLHEFFPGISALNRGIPGDNLNGLYFRLDEDVLPYQPEQVVFHGGINQIGEDNPTMLRRYQVIGNILKDAGIKVYFASILPLRHGDQWNRFQYQDKIAELNSQLRKIAEKDFAGFIDYHSALLDDNNELAEKFARPDGTHITFYGYQVMAKILQEKVDLF
ncbi:MAG: hypothetical protein J6W00_09385 [Lentisphaeria bacterium]|nr:hypothetical protein [Lentisphaeria bacterium]